MHRAVLIFAVGLACGVLAASLFPRFGGPVALAQTGGRGSRELSDEQVEEWRELAEGLAVNLRGHAIEQRQGALGDFEQLGEAYLFEAEALKVEFMARAMPRVSGPSPAEAKLLDEVKAIREELQAVRADMAARP